MEKPKSDVQKGKLKKMSELSKIDPKDIINIDPAIERGMGVAYILSLQKLTTNIIKNNSPRMKRIVKDTIDVCLNAAVSSGKINVILFDDQIEKNTALLERIQKDLEISFDRIGTDKLHLDSIVPYMLGLLFDENVSILEQNESKLKSAYALIAGFWTIFQTYLIKLGYGKADRENFLKYLESIAKKEDRADLIENDLSNCEIRSNRLIEEINRYIPKSKKMLYSIDDKIEYTIKKMRYQKESLSKLTNMEMSSLEKMSNEIYTKQDDDKKEMFTAESDTERGSAIYPIQAKIEIIKEIFNILKVLGSSDKEILAATDKISISEFKFYIYEKALDLVREIITNPDTDKYEKEKKEPIIDFGEVAIYIDEIVDFNVIMLDDNLREIIEELGGKAMEKKKLEREKIIIESIEKAQEYLEKPTEKNIKGVNELMLLGKEILESYFTDVEMVNFYRSEFIGKDERMVRYALGYKAAQNIYTSSILSKDIGYTFNYLPTNIYNPFNMINVLGKIEEIISRTIKSSRLKSQKS
ncbi:hypothetical protein JW890_05220 [candidate division WOR-3 bacterium]|nr:hypothetical protein [candidate division WOR-3 bacterium]